MILDAAACDPLVCLDDGDTNAVVAVEIALACISMRMKPEKFNSKYKIYIKSMRVGVKMTSEMKSTSSNYLGPFSSMAIEATAELAD
jgi:hypothetical protein